MLDKKPLSLAEGWPIIAQTLEVPFCHVLDSSTRSLACWRHTPKICFANGEDKLEKQR